MFDGNGDVANVLGGCSMETAMLRTPRIREDINERQKSRGETKHSHHALRD
jgi:hypothetical protein